MDWAAEWIWCVEEPRHNVYLYARKAFQLDQAVRRSAAYCTANSRYKLFINGRFRGRGPARCDPRWQQYDEYDLSRHLRPGANVIAVLVHYLGVEHLGCMQGRGGFLFQCDVLDVEGRSTCIATDRTWKVRRASAWREAAPRRGPYTGFAEIYDARAQPSGWELPGFDDRDWEVPQVIGAPPQEPWRELVVRDIPALSEQEVFPASVVGMGGWVLPSRSKGLPAGRKQAADLSPSPVAEGEVRFPRGMLRRETPAAWIKPEGAGRAVYVVLDFGREVAGHPRLDLDGSEGTVLDVAYGDRLEAGRVNPQRDDGYHADRYVMPAGRHSWEPFERRGFRYLQLAFSRCRKPVRVHAVSANQVTYPVQYRAAFACSDPLLERIWEVGRTTLHQCMGDVYENSPSGQEALWGGDARVAALVNYYVFGDPQLAARCLRLIGQSQQADGSVLGVYPTDRALIVPDFALLWVSSLWEYYLHVGDAALLKQLYPKVRRLLQWFESWVSPDGLLSGVPGSVFLDWADLDKRGEVTALNALYCGALTEAARIAAVLGHAEAAHEYLGRCQVLKSDLNKHLWNDAQGTYADCRQDGVQGDAFSQQTSALALLYDVAPSDRAAQLSSQLHKDQDSSSGVQTPYSMFYVLEALYRHGVDHLALTVMRSRWGAMLDEGATTWWEHFHPQGSLCHARSAGPTFELSSKVLGVSPSEAGFRTVRIQPYPCDLTWAQGSVPTPVGDAHVRWERAADGTRFEMHVALPARCKAEIGFPRLGMKRPEVLLNQELVWRNEKLFPNRHVRDVALEARHILFCVDRGGTYVFTGGEA